MKAIRVAGLIALAAAIVAACSSRQREAGSAVVPQKQEQVHIVKGEQPSASELALLMREMTAFADSTRSRLEKEQQLLPFPDQFRKLMTAEATPGMKDASFDPYAQAWLYHLDALYKAPEAERTGVFNTLVQTCAGCHSTMCPGPLVKIRKLGLP